MAVEPPPEPTTFHRLAMGVSVLGPLFGFAAAVWYAASTGHFGWFDLFLVIGGMWLTGQGITLGYHRMLTHSSFKAGPITRNALTSLGALAMQKGPLLWSAAHRKHHRYSDKDGDPHSPHLAGDSPWSWFRGLWHAHVGWLFTGDIMTADYDKYVPDLLEDKFAVWSQKYWEAFWLPVSFAIPTLMGWAFYGTADGAIRGLLWGGFARTFLTHHVTWSVNSVCHYFGRREFQSNDESRNNWLCAMLTSGEGWHNNHHAFPTSARLGLHWWQFDGGWVVLRTLEMLGLVYDVKVPSQESMAKKKVVA